MVEAGANEIPEAEILDALDIAHEEIKKLCAAQRELAEKAGKAKIEVEVPQVDAELYEQIKASHGAALDAATQVEDKLERQDADQGGRGAGARAVLRRPRGRRPTPSTAPARPARLRQAREDDHPRAHRRPEEAPRRPRRRRDPRRSRSRSASRRARTARRCSRAARRRRSASSRSAPRARRCGSTRSGWRPPSATSTTTTSRRSRSGRPASCAAPSAATSATARSPSGRWCR